VSPGAPAVPAVSERPLRVALLVGRFGPGTGTGGIAAHLARWLVGRGHEVAVWCRVAPPDEARIAGVEVHPLGARRTAAARVPAGFVRLALDRVPGCEVVRASGGVHRAWLAARRRAPGSPPLGPRDWLEARLDRQAARSARHVICNSLHVLGQVVAYHGVSRARVTLVPTGVDPSRFRPDPELRADVRGRLGVGGGDRIAMFVGHGFRRKGLPVAVEAFARAAGPGDRLVVAGHDAHAARWLAPARLGLGRRLVALGPVDVAKWLPAADAMILPSRYDAASNAVIEALAAGVAPVASACDGAAERIVDRRLVVGDPDDVQGFTRALRYAWGSPDCGARCREAAGCWSDARMMAARVERILVETAHG
jgi:glycosyltransferase involved in cell wall biosynthesis